MNRRTMLGAAGGAAIGLLAGCLSEGSSGSEYETEEFDGQEIPLAPLEDVYEWYEDGDTRFVDTRGEGHFEESHIEGAVLSPGHEGLEEDDPTEEWDADTRIVTYCDCPHALAVQRGSGLLAAGFEDVYALDDGFPAWEDAEYPVGGEARANVEVYELRGETDPAYAGEYVWASDLEVERYESAQIDADGSYVLSLYFDGITDETPLEIETPEYTLESTLGELRRDVITA